MRFVAIHDIVLTELDDTALDIRVTRILLRIGVPASCRGYDYLRRSVILAYHTPEITVHITKTLYPKIARLCHAASAACVGRTCRRVVDRVCESRSSQLCEYFGRDIRGYHPSCAQFISALARYLHENE